MPDAPHPMLHPVWWQLNGELDQQGPGSDASTLRALARLPELPPGARIADLGCGPGRQSLALARSSGARIVALDLLPPFLRRLRARAERARLGARIQIVQADMGRPPLPAECFDLVWSEGAVYNLGFEAGLGRWRRLLRAGGCAAVTELSWLADPPPATRDYWERHYPGIAGVDENLERARRAGYRVIDHFALPRSDWDAYYEPIEARARPLRSAHADDPAALRVLAESAEEVAVLDASAGSYGYVFYLLARV